MRHLLLLALCAVHCVEAKRLETPAESMGLLRTPDAAETFAFIDRLDAASDSISVREFGTTAQGRTLKAVVAGAFKPGREVVLVQAGIHAGEIEGKDAGLMLLAMIAADERRTRAWLEHATLVFVPIFNLDGHERRSRFNRINQNGPVEMGWRGTAQRLNLNRDYVKAEAPEMRALIGLIESTQPDLLIDTHTTNGADYQYDLTWFLEEWDNQHPAIRDWQREAVIGRVFPALEQQGHLLAPYLEPIDGADLRKGFSNFGSGPRYSTGYAALRNRAGLLVETHMLKPYPVRVRATFDLLAAILDEIAAHPGQLRRAVNRAEADTIVRAGRSDLSYPIQMANAGRVTDFAFKGFDWTLSDSPISGAKWIRYDTHKPITITVPFLRDLKVSQSVAVPFAYVVPRQWSTLVERLRAHGVILRAIPRDAQVRAEVSWLGNPRFATTSFEGHVAIQSFDHRRAMRESPIRAGDWLVPMDQPLANIALHILEPDAPDSALRWGEFNIIFEQREYADMRIAEQLARDLLADNAQLKAAFEAKLAAEPEFAKNPYARLNWFVQQSDWREWDLGLYPVLRLDATAVKSVVP